MNWPVKYERHVIVRASGLVEKQWANGKDWTEYPCLHDDGHVTYDKPEAFSLKERAFIAKRLFEIKVCT